MKILLAFDPGSSCGYAVASVDELTRSATLIHYGIIEPKSSTYVGDSSIDLMQQVKDIIIKYGAQEVSLEDYFASSKFASGTDLNYYYRGAIQIQVRSMGLHYEMLNISNWKVFVAGRSMPTKEQKIKYGKAPAKKIMIQEALWNRFNIRFPNHSISPTTGKPIQFRMDSVDAVGQLFYFCNLRYNIINFTSTVAIPPDVEFKRVNKKQFQY